MLKVLKNLPESWKIRQGILEENDLGKLLQYIVKLETEGTSTEVLVQAINSRAWYGLLSGKFAEAEALLHKGIALDSSYKYLHTNMPPALLLQGKIEEAMVLFRKWKDVEYGGDDYATYREVFLADLLEFEKAGVIPEERETDVERVRALLNQEKAN